MAHGFDLLEPTTVPEALAMLAEAGAEGRLMAGGTTLLILIKQRLYQPRCLISLHRIAGLDQIRPAADGGVSIGARTSPLAVSNHPLIAERHPLLQQACRQVANIRIRGMATLGGSLCHGDYQADAPVALVALGARVRLTSLEGERTLPVEEFLQGYYSTALGPSEMLTEVQVPPPVPGSRSCYHKFTLRSKEDRPTVAVAAALAGGGDGACQSLRVVLGAVAPRPLRLHEAEALAEGRFLSKALIQQIAAMAAEGAEPLDDIRGSAWYKREMAGVFTQRALEELSEAR